MKFAILALAAIGAVSAVPIDSEVLAKAKALYKRHSPMVDQLQKEGLIKRQSTSGANDIDILNFALNLEYLEAQFYHYAYYGTGLDGSLLTGRGDQGGVQGGAKVPFQNQNIKRYAEELALDEQNHVKALRAALGNNAVAQPQINIGSSFTAAAQAAGIIGQGQTFSPYTSDTNFLLGAFLFEDVGVTAYNGGAPLISSKQYLAAAASILAIEAYHGATIRTSIFESGQQAITNAAKEAKAIGAVDSGKSQGLIQAGVANMAPADFNSLAYARTPGQVISIVYLSGEAGATSGGFFPKGLNGYFHIGAGSGN